MTKKVDILIMQLSTASSIQNNYVFKIETDGSTNYVVYELWKR